MFQRPFINTGLRLLALIALFHLATPARAQQSFQRNDIFSQDTLVWCGIDYREASFMGDFSGKDLTEYFHGWNKLFTEEPDKYDLKKFLEKHAVIIDIATAESKNQATTPRINPDHQPPFDKATIPVLISSYQLSRAQGIALVFIADRYDRIKKDASHYVVFFDIASRKVLLSQRYTSAPDGIGVRNYWAGALYDTLKALRANYKSLKKKGSA